MHPILKMGGKKGGSRSPGFYLREEYTITCGASHGQSKIPSYRGWPRLWGKFRCLEPPPVVRINTGTPQAGPHLWPCPGDGTNSYILSP